jgi:hypothetical protein
MFTFKDIIKIRQEAAIYNIIMHHLTGKLTTVHNSGLQYNINFNPS